jgi:hypothetical protein
MLRSFSAVVLKIRKPRMDTNGREGIGFENGIYSRQFVSIRGLNLLLLAWAEVAYMYFCRIAR